MQEDLLDPRLTERRNRHTVDIDLAEPLEIVDRINAEDRKVPDAVAAERASIARAIEIAVESFRRGGRLLYVGAGTSGRLGVLDAAECPPTFGTDPDLVQGIIAGGYVALVRSQEGAEDRADEAVAAIDERRVTGDDFVFGIAASSTTPFVRAALEHASKLGARTGFLCCTDPGPEMRELVDVCIVPLVGPEVIAGSTRMKAGTATKLVLNTLTTGAMIRLGKVYENLMVDLQATSAKLVDRGERILMALAEVEREEARARITEADGSVKLALLMSWAGVGRGPAELMLAESGGFVRTALERWQGRSESPYDRYPATPPDAGARRLMFDALRGLPRRVRELVTAVPRERLGQRPRPDRWSAKEQILHLVEVDEMMMGRIRRVLNEDRPTLPDWDEEVENRRLFDSEARDTDLEVLLRRLTDGRAALIARVESEPESALGRVGVHELWGEVTIYQLLRHVAYHDDRHARGLRALLAAG